ncbi:MAG: DNA polymerase III subunit alpha [Bacteroidales bacterium]|nr:DNA polymerase III subunit alpha [Bacteroidales bacterium]
MVQFTHLHVHSHYSMLDGMSKVPALVDKCMKNGMYSMALTDHGNMFGIKELSDYCKKINGASKAKLGDLEKDLKKAAGDDAKVAEIQAKIDALKEKMKTEIPFKPIFGIEAYCARRDHLINRKFAELKENKDKVNPHIDMGGWHLILLAKNKKGYQNLCKLSSQAYTDGYYGKPRIDHALLEKYHEGVICSSACLGGEIPQYILNGKIDEAEKAAAWFKNLFGDDFYIELQRHKTDKPNANTQTYEEQQRVNPVLIDIARKLNIKIICTNDAHFVDEEHGEAHDRLICLSTNKNYDDERMHYTKQEWLKTPDEMFAIFSDLPESLENTMEIADKVEVYDIDSGPIMPKFPIPEDFGTEEEYRKKFTNEDIYNEFTRNEKGEVVMSREDGEKKIKKIGGYEKLYRIKLEADYLNKLAWEGAAKRYGENLDQGIDPNGDPIPPQKVKDNIIFELHVMKTMGFPGYFLIVRDYIRAAREELDVSVGPGRGSAAGSVVAYCLGITNIDPLRYDLLFERFLNPDRISLPDIDVDFDDAGRGKVLDWVTHKYGAEKVAHIITYGTMATKNSIADVARVHQLPLSLSNALKSYVPDKFDDFIDPETGKTFAEGKEKQGRKIPKVKLAACFKYVPQLKAARYCEYNEELNALPNYNDYKDLISHVLEYASQLEDTNRQTGIHACGVIIGADDLTNFAPICCVRDKDTDEDINVTQYDGHVIESVGLIKMDFLGLITLTLIKETLKNIRHRTGEEIDIEKIPLDDAPTYKLFSEGRTIGVFQFESPGMQKYLRELQPTKLTDLIAMNALYRPGPIQYIPTFINRAQGREPVTYDLDAMESRLKDTYGVTVYQEQVMLLSRDLADFTRGESDKLRKAMGKKQMAILAELKPKFINQAMEKGHPKEVLEKIWTDWEAFASYAFNKSHAACYAWVAYQTGYLKANYPAEYMAANLTISKDTITDVTKFMEECKSMKLKVQGPNVNESELNFAVNKDGVIIYGLGGVKGVGEAAVEAIISEREKNGKYVDIYDFVERVDLSKCNRKAIENLAVAGAFDCLGIKREQFFALTKLGDSGSEMLTKYGQRVQSDRHEQQVSLFGDIGGAVEIARPALPDIINSWSTLERLGKEKEVVGIYLTAHPLDMYKFEMKYIVNTPCIMLTDEKYAELKNREFTVAGIVTSIKRRGTDKKGRPFLIAVLEDYSGGCEVALFGNDYPKFANFFEINAYICITGTVTESAYDPNRLYRTFKSICYIGDLLKNPQSHSLSIALNYHAVNKDLLDDLNHLLTSTEKKYTSRGELIAQAPAAQVHFELIDRANSRHVRLHSRSHGVVIGPEVIEFINNHTEQVLDAKWD